jgi:FKBP-type peptidyl-prolyl cis-trans isomerase FklB
MKEGSGNSPKKTDKVKTHYKGMLIDGSVFDSSYKRNEPAVFGVGQVIQGWIEALQLMKVGSKWKLFIPAELAYGERGAPPVIGPNEVLVFEIELLDIVN